MDSIDRFVKLMNRNAEAVPMVDVSTAILRTIRGENVRIERLDYLPLACSMVLAVAASLFVLLSLPGTLVVDRSMTELVNPISMLVP